MKLTNSVSKLSFIVTFKGSWNIVFAKNLYNSFSYAFIKFKGISSKNPFKAAYKKKVCS